MTRKSERPGATTPSLSVPVADRATEKDVNTVNDLAEILDSLVALITRYVALPSDEAATAIALWCAHTWTINAFEATPRLAVISPELGSGKTRLLEVLELVVRSPIFASSLTNAVAYRAISERKPTLLIDEVDSIFGKKTADNHEDLRATLNGGYRKGASVYRMTGVGPAMRVTEFETFTPVALAGIGKALPDTVMSRAILIEMRRRRSDERVDAFRRREARELAEGTKADLAAWAADAEARLSQARPKLPDGITDRAADIWEPLIALADEAGEPWDQEARNAALVLTGKVAGREPTLGVKLLADCHAVFKSDEKLTSNALCSRLADLEESPWGDLGYGRPIDPRGLALRLRPFDIRPGVIRFGDETHRGYEKSLFADAWERYLPSQETETGETDVTTAEEPGVSTETGEDHPPKHPKQVTHRHRTVEGVTDVSPLQPSESAALEILGAELGAIDGEDSPW